MTVCRAGAQCPQTWLPDPIKHGTSGPIYAIARLANGDLIVGGFLTLADDVSARCIAQQRLSG